MKFDDPITSMMESVDEVHAHTNMSLSLSIAASNSSFIICNHQMPFRFIYLMHQQKRFAINFRFICNWQKLKVIHCLVPLPINNIQTITSNRLTEWMILSLSFSLWFSKMFGSQILCCVFDDWRNLFVEKIWFKSLILIWKAWKDYDWSSKRFVLIVCDYQKPVCVHFEFPFVQYAND